MKKFEYNDTVILLMTKKEEATMREAIDILNTEMCVDLHTNTNKMAELVKRYAFPQIYSKTSYGYSEINSLSEDEYVMFMDELGRYGYTCNYSNADDTFTIG